MLLMKNKIIFFLSFVVLIISSCTVYHIQTDDFRNEKTVIYKHSLGVQERRLSYRYASITYRRVIGHDGSENFKIYFVLNSRTGSFPIDSIGYMKAGDKKFEVKTSELDSRYRTSTTTKTSTTIVQDSTSTKTSNTVSSETSEWLTNRFTINADEEIISAIKNGDNLLFRFYFGAETATFELKKSQLEKLKNMFEQQ
jgi:hypothetical protein